MVRRADSRCELRIVPGWLGQSAPEGIMLGPVAGLSVVSLRPLQPPDREGFPRRATLVARSSEGREADSVEHA